MVEDEIIGGENHRCKRRKLKPEFNSKIEEEEEGIPYIAFDLVINILLRLPASFLVRCRQVCKAWCEVIDSVSFAHTHHTGYNAKQPRVLFHAPELGTLHSYRLKFDEGRLHPVIQGIWNSNPPHGLSYLGYGLFGFQDLFGEYQTYLHNPIRGQTLMLPPTTLSRSSGTYFSGFDSTTNTYKLVHFYQVTNYEPKVEVYTLGTSSWRRISAVPPCEFCCQLAPVPAYGDVHWKSNNMIVSFDIKKEEFKATPLPCLQPNHYYRNLFDWRGALAVVVQQQSSSYLAIWVLKDYDNSRWEKDYNITYPGCLQGNIRVNAWNDGMIIRNYSDSLFYYDPKSGGSTRIDNDQPSRCIEASTMINYTANLISLKNYGDSVKLSWLWRVSPSKQNSQRASISLP